MGNASKINQALSKVGFAGLFDPRSLLIQIAYVVKGHDDLRKLLMKVEPEKRLDCYESLRSRLSFDVKPLDVYIAEGCRIAEEHKWPHFDAATNQYTPFKSAEVKTAEAAIDSEANHFEQFTCSKCTVTQSWPAHHRKEARKLAKAEGWTFRILVMRWVARCPECSA